MLTVAREGANTSRSVLQTRSELPCSTRYRGLNLRNWKVWSQGRYWYALPAFANVPLSCDVVIRCWRVCGFVNLVHVAGRLDAVDLSRS
jgi:hypothetical protein